MDIKELQIQQQDKEEELKSIKDQISNYRSNELKQLYGDNFSCNHCRYSCISDVDSCDGHTLCTKYKCMMCHDNCSEFQLENRISNYFKEYYEYRKDLYDALTNIFGDKEIVDFDDSNFESIKTILELISKIK